MEQVTVPRKYQPYPEYKDTGVEWISEIPANWATSKLRYMFTCEKGLTITKENLRDEGIPCVNYGEVHSKYGFEVDPTQHPLKCVDDSYLKTSADALLHAGDFVFADTSEDIDGSGNFTQLTSEVITFAGYHTIIVRPVDKKNHRFFAYLFDSKEFRTQIRHAVKGVKVFSITQAILRGADIWLPSLAEQRTIAAFLDYETARIDKLIAKQQRLIELLKEKRQAVISHCVSIKAAEGHVKLSYAVNLITGFPFLSTGFRHEPGDNIPLLRGINVGVDQIKWDEVVYWASDDCEHLKEYFLKSGDIVFGMDRPWISSGARVAEITSNDTPCLLLQRVARIRTTDSFYQPFIRLCLSSNEFRAYVEADLTGVSVPHISPDQIKSFYIRNISLEEQRVITDRILAKIEKLNAIEKTAFYAIELMQERRTALISAAVTGKIDLRGWTAPTQEAAA
ncbi:restriction endonuclease subunit S [Klebsiella quasipneumoniae subsp. similipneumoniae]|uniref:restriction endonuclease subunit S n=1 Tax=Klebsiella pneumoniae complex TaxID=3390273 RepID=UPI0020739E80|nr:MULTISPECIES: restriction endonuclease subunit S [Klebsiella]MCM5920043.1 restriction endonuclease subunit S [Klebsiella pneumoniae]MCS6401574.1 restriction endonuclease subunit S [Klebsiella quasipneumoniae subsp. similipneumoniae]MCS6434687.1 restriction endonuclease subunit S [Klebsiella pneumoniae]